MSHCSHMTAGRVSFHTAKSLIPLFVSFSSVLRSTPYSKTQSGELKNKRKTVF